MPKRILVVDDESLVRWSLRERLSKDGHEVTEASNGREAETIVKREPVDLALLDLRLPDMDGLEATRAIRDAESQGQGHIPIIGVTAHALQGARARCLEAGMDDHISKPFHSTHLFETVERISARAG